MTYACKLYRLAVTLPRVQDLTKRGDMSEGLSAALDYASRGIAVFPCEPGGKRPVILLPLGEEPNYQCDEYDESDHARYYSKNFQEDQKTHTKEVSHALCKRALRSWKYCYSFPVANGIETVAPALSKL